VVKMEVFQYDDETERYNGFHCGDCFRIKVNGKWKDVRIEKGDYYYVIDEDGFVCGCNKLVGMEIQRYEREY